MNIYQAIWETDMCGNGIQPILPNDHKDLSSGYAMIDTECKHHFLKEVYIPERKRESFQLVEKLFDNYSLNQTSREIHSPFKSREVDDFLTMAIHSAPLRLAKQYIQETSNQKFNCKQWSAYLYDLWFRQFNWGSGKDLSGFEHVFIGEQKGRQLVGHHFWYKYWLEEKAELSEHGQYEITSPGPFVVIFNYHLMALDEKKRKYTRLRKRKCAFLVGLSAEGLMAMGTVRAQVFSPKTFEMNNFHFNLELIMSPDGKSIRTFYPN